MEHSPGLSRAVQVWAWVAARSRAEQVAFGLGGLLFAVYLSQVVSYGDFIAEDAAITFAYSKNWIAGGGWTVNPGEDPVEGFSNPTWTVLLALLMPLGLFHPMLTPKVLGVLFAVGSAVLGMRLVRRLQPAASPWIAWLVPMGLLADPYFVFWSVGGLENAIYGFFLVLSLWLWAEDRAHPERLPRAGLGLVLTALSRPEGLMYAVAIGLDALWDAVARRRLRGLAFLVGSVTAAMGVVLVWRLTVFGHPVPNTWYAKSGSGGYGFVERVTDLDLPGWVYMWGFLDGAHLWWSLPLGLVALASADARQRGGLAVVLVLPASVFFVLISMGDWMTGFRLLTPFQTVLPIAVALGVGAVAEWAPLRRDARRQWAVLGLAGALVLRAGWLGGVAAQDMRDHPTIATSWMVPTYDRIVRLLDELAVPPERATLLISDIGHIAYHANGRYRLVDLFGLVDGRVAHAFHTRAGVAALWEYGFVENDPVLLQVAGPMAAKWRLAEHPDFADRFVALDAVATRNRPIGLFLRRDLFELPWKPEYAAAPRWTSGSVWVLSAGGVPQPDGTVQLDVRFAVSAVGKTQPKVRLRFEGSTTSEHDVTLLPSIPARVFEPGRVYRDHRRIPVPPGVTGVRKVSLVGVPALARLPEPVLPEARRRLTVSKGAGLYSLDTFGPDGVPKEMEFLAAPNGGATLKRITEPGIAGVRMTVPTTALAQLCTKPIAYAPRVRVQTRVRVRAIHPDVGWKVHNIIVKPVGGRGQVVHRAEVAHPAWRLFENEVVYNGPANKPMQVCFEFTNGAGEVDVDALVVTRLPKG